MDKRIEVVRYGDESGNDMIIRVGLSSGRGIYGFATMNSYGGGWDLGPTWNYWVSGNPCFLVDTGRRGMGGRLLDMLSYAGVHPAGPDMVVLSHGHEDHDGGLYEIVRRTGAEVWAHKCYKSLIRICPEKAPSPDKAMFPASCWHCPMPETFSNEHCAAYHKERVNLEIHELAEADGFPLGEGVGLFHLPGHAPDALAFLIDEEALLVGDNILPDITPHPSREGFFDLTASVLPEEFSEPGQLYGLRAYLRTLDRLQALLEELPQVLVLPAHRLYYKSRWNELDPKSRLDELKTHHKRRCADILDIVRQGAKTAEGIARSYFNSDLLRGFGINMAINEVLSHCELLEAKGEVSFEENGKITVPAK